MNFSNVNDVYLSVELNIAWFWLFLTYFFLFVLAFLILIVFIMLIRWVIMTIIGSYDRPLKQTKEIKVAEKGVDARNYSGGNNFDIKREYEVK